MSVVEYILETLKEIGKGTIEAFFPKHYSFTALGRWTFGLDQQKRKKPNFNFNYDRKYFSVALSRLKKQGLVERRGSKKNSIWKLTAKGRNFLENKKKAEKSLKSDKKIKLVIFDIPEKYKSKRDWLRTSLASFNYKSLQKSVWIGNTILPIDFLEELRDLDLMNYIHIFSIEDKGTIDPDLFDMGAE